MIRVRYRLAKLVEKSGSRFLEGDSMHPKIPCSLL